MKKHQLRAPLLVLVALWVGLAVFVWATYGQLPERVATHFGHAGAPNAWMSRTGHVKFIMGFAIGLPVLLHLVFPVIRRLGGAGCNIPHRSYWLAPERQEGTLGYVQTRFAWFICLLVAFFAGVHYLILNANTHYPARLSIPLLACILGGFLLIKVIWLCTLLIPLLRVPK
jgi:uncharacterized membrane protein